MLFLVLRMMYGPFYVRPELPEDVPGITRRQSGTASHQCMPGIRAALGVPGVGDEGGPVNAREARIGGDARAAVVGRHENVAHGGGAKAAPEAGLARRDKARV